MACMCVLVSDEMLCTCFPRRRRKVGARRGKRQTLLWKQLSRDKTSHALVCRVRQVSSLIDGSTSLVSCLLNLSLSAEEELLTPDDAADLVEELLPAKIRSRQLGLALKIPRRVVDRIHRNFLSREISFFTFSSNLPIFLSSGRHGGPLLMLSGRMRSTYQH